MQLEKSHGRHSTNGDFDQDDEEYWGSLPASLVQQYERRADEIGQGLDDIDVEELKEYVLNSHYRHNSRPSSRANITGEYSSAATELKKLDDFTALVTATILQALPFLSRLNQLLDLWTIRLIILRGAPRFLHDLERVRSEMMKCWAAITPPTEDDGTELTKATMSAMKSSIENQLGALGRRLDRFLDALEGRNECVPDSWIDDFESCESDYSAWTVHAERVVVQNDWARQRQLPIASVNSTATQGSSTTRNGLLAVSETEDPMSDDDAVRRPSQSIRSSVDEAQLAKSPSFTSSTASQQARVTELSTTEPWTNTNRAVSAPLSMASHNSPGIPGEVESEGRTSAVASGIERSASTNSRSKEETTGSVAAKRAAFLRGIEGNQSLNKSDAASPVRPFERASNAFTRLFKKDKSPEQIAPKRTASRLAESRTSTTERNALSPASFVSSRFNSVSPTVSTQSAASSSKTSVDDDADDALPSGSASRGLQEASTAENALPLTSESSGSLSSPFHSPEKEDFPEQWPLSPSAGTQPSAPSCASQRHDDELETPSTPMDTDVFHRTFIESFPGPENHKHKAGRRASLPGSQRLPSHDVPLLSENTEWAPVARAVRRASASPARPSTAPSFAVSHAPGNDTMPRLTNDLRAEQLHIRPTQFKPASSLQLRIPNDIETSDGEIASSFRVKRASVASIEAFSRSELKSIDVPKSSRQSSVSSRRSPPQTPAGPSRRPSGVQQQERASLDNAATAVAATNGATVAARRSSLPSQASMSPQFSTPEITRSSPVLEHTPASLEASSAPLNIVMKKLRSNKPTAMSEAMHSSPISTQGSPPAVTPTHADQFDRHVSEVLERLPAPIRFKARAGAETPLGRVRGYSGSRSKTPTMRSSQKSSDMTIAPAESSPRKSRAAADSEVKLYHLTHTGREDPIKLFVRLVGEGERVMVRVGGGWADLADYLRDFASHHGSRTVSEGNLEVAALPTAPLSTRKFSNPAEYQRAKTPTTPREVRPVSSDEDDIPLKRPPFDSRESAVSISGTPTTAGITTSSTPKSTKSGSSNSRPSTASNSRPSSRQAQNSNAAEIGLSGPSSAAKRAGLPAEKRAWVEGMISRAKKSASAEKSKEDKEKYFNEMGKAGSTRRVIFRSGSGAGALQDKTNK